MVLCPQSGLGCWLDSLNGRRFWLDERIAALCCHVLRHLTWCDSPCLLVLLLLKGQPVALHELCWAGGAHPKLEHATYSRTLLRALTMLPLRLRTAQSRSDLCTLSPRVGIIHVL